MRQYPDMPIVSVFSTSSASEDVLERIRGLLEESFEGDFSEDDWDHALGGWHVVITEGDEAVSHAAVVPRRMQFGDRVLRSGYLEAVATAPSRRRSGLGSLVMTEAAKVVRREFDVGVLSTGRHRFYERLGWERWRGPTFVRREGQPVRTPDEDDGIMVLRFGLSVDLEPAAPIVCESRRGDDW